MINLYEIYNRKRRKYGISDLADYREAFVDAVNLTYSELNEKVFEANTLSPIGSFDDLIDTRLAGFTSITFDSDSDDAIQRREFWSIEYKLERTDETNGFTDTITDDGVNLVISIADSVVTITSTGNVVASYTLPNTDTHKIKFTSDPDGNNLTVNDSLVDMTYTTGDSDTVIPIGTIDTAGSGHVINGLSGWELLRYRVFSAATLILDYNINDGDNDSDVTLTDKVNSFTATVSGGFWSTRYIAPSTMLDDRYRSAIEFGTDFHLQDGGQWGLEPEQERERKWYGRGIRSAREVYSQLSTYTSPLNP